MSKAATAAASRTTTARARTFTADDKSIVGGLSRRFRNYMSRREVKRLLTFDDRALADIGLTRGDVEHALSQPFTVDCSGVLVDMHQRRRG